MEAKFVGLPEQRYRSFRPTPAPHAPWYWRYHVTNALMPSSIVVLGAYLMGLVLSFLHFDDPRFFANGRTPVRTLGYTDAHRDR